MMKLVVAVLTVLMSMVLFGCQSSIIAEDYESDVYTEEQLAAAVNVITDTFANDFPQCTLQEIEYDEDYSESLEEINKEMYAVDNAVVFTSTFVVDDDYESGPLNAGMVYEDYEWTLTMDADGNWTLITCGYQ